MFGGKAKTGFVALLVTAAEHIDDLSGAVYAIAASPKSIVRRGPRFDRLGRP